MNKNVGDADYFIKRLYDENPLDDDIIRNIVQEHANSNPQQGIKTLKKIEGMGAIADVQAS